MCDIVENGSVEPYPPHEGSDGFKRASFTQFADQRGFEQSKRRNMGLALGLMLLCAAIAMLYIALPRDNVGLLSNWGVRAEFYLVLVIIMFCLGVVLMLH
jgi:hypothetical protein